MNRSVVVKWIPALAMMMLIFWFSSQPASELPNFEWADPLLKKSGHVVGYALLAASYRHALGADRKRGWMAWLMAILFALSDEFHQSFVPGRHPSVWDIVIFDNIGALIGIWIGGRFADRKRPAIT